MHIYLYKRNKNGIKILMGFGFLMVLFGLAGFALHHLTGRSLFSGERAWQELFWAVQGLITIFLAWNGLKGQQYFISWDDDRIMYFLPGEGIPVIIETKDIHSVQIKGAQVVISCGRGVKNTFSLNHFYFPQRRQVREFFESLAEKPTQE